MDTNSLFDFLESANEKPDVFSKYTASELWTGEHTSAQMLAYHLDGKSDLSSRNERFIDESVFWMIEHFGLSDGSRVADFGCGPGLYSSHLAKQGMDVLGIDFSPRSIAYAREFARDNKLNVTYVEDNYLNFQPSGSFDLIIMIMCDFCALSPEQRATLLKKFKGLLADGGHIVLDVYSMYAFDKKEEKAFYEKNQLNGFWSANPYYALVSNHKYEVEKVSLDKYTIVEAGRQWQVYNWLQYFTPETIEREVVAAGLEVGEFLGNVAGQAYDVHSPEFAVVLRRG